MIVSRVAALIHRFGLYSVAPQKVSLALNQQNGSLWSVVKTLFRPSAKQRLFKTKGLIHPQLPARHKLYRHPHGSNISQWTQLMTKRLLQRGNLLAFGLVGVSIRDTVNGPSFLSECEEEENRYDQIKQYFYHRFAEKADEESSQLLPATLSLQDLSFTKFIGKGCNAAVYEATVNQSQEKVAVKMMFNYAVESNAQSIMREMRAECVPFPGSFADECVYVRPKLPAHPNIIQIKAVFTDLTPLLPGAAEHYPVALPPRLNEDEGLGRNKTLFLVMKYYQCNLSEYLRSHSPSNETSLHLLGQLMGGVDFLQSHKIVHRDLKKDNILMSKCDDVYPHLVISDFGCCHTSLTLYLMEETSRGGNVAHLPPEVLTVKPGLFSSIDYSTCDLWASAAIAYELWGYKDPAIAAISRDGKCFLINSRKPLQLEYISQAHRSVNVLLAKILQNEPKNRPSARVSANLCVLLLLLPQSHLDSLRNVELRKRMQLLTGFIQENEETIINSSSHLCRSLAMSLSSSTLSDIYSALQLLD